MLSTGVLALCASNTIAAATTDGQADFIKYRDLLIDANTRSWDQVNESSLKLSMQIQTRYIFNARSELPSGTVTNGFEARRTKIKATGRLDDPRIRYTVGMAFSRSTGAMSIEDVYARFQMSDEWTLKVGQFRPSVMREQAISSKYQLAAERSLLSAAFGQSYNQGVAFLYRTDKVRATASVMDVTDTFAGDRIWEYILRGEVMLSGKRSEMSDFTSFRDDDPATMIGAGIGYLDADPADPADADTSTLNWSVDLTAEFGGSSVFVALVGAQIEEDGSPDVDQFGALIQGAFFINDKTELFARFTHGDDDSGEGLNLVELGMNHYLNRHNAKFTIDAGYSFDQMTTTWRSGGAGWRPDIDGEEGQFVLRGQVQLLF